MMRLGGGFGLGSGVTGIVVAMVLLTMLPALLQDLLFVVMWFLSMVWPYVLGGVALYVLVLLSIRWARR